MLNTRETVLAWVTGVTVLFGVTYWVGQPRIAEMREAGKVRAELAERKRLAERLLRQQDEVDAGLQEFRKQLPQHPQNEDVTASLLILMERTAKEHGVSLLRREPDKEKSVGDLYELAVNCTWEAELEPLVHFLYALQSQGVMLDIRQLTVTPAQGQGARLKGNVTVDFAYTRTGSGLDSVEVETAPAK